ncbi:MAG: outer-membrane lipoprotein carrier protein LolA [Candidatus Acidiferrum sp.]
MRRTNSAFLIAMLVIGLCSAISMAKTGQGPGKLTLDTVLQFMDHAGQGFKSLTADIEHIKYTAVVKDTATETGKIWVRKDSKMRIDFVNPDPRTIIRDGDHLYIYTPKIGRAEEYNIGKHLDMADQYLALGFGSQSERLKKNFTISLAPEETLDGRKMAVLELVPLNEEAKKQIDKIQIWVDEASWLPVQQKFFETGSGDYFISKYTNVLENLKISDGKFKPDWPKGTKVEKHSG